MKSFFKKTSAMVQRGFTLVEFIVILSIFSIMASVALFNFTGFENNVSLTNLAHDIALTIRQAQVYGTAASPNFRINNAYVGTSTRGIHFTDDPNGGFLSTFIIFADSAADKIYNAGEPVIDEIKINSAAYIKDIQVGNTSQTTSSVNGFVDITFTRPDPDAFIWANNTSWNYAAITVASPGINKERIIEIFKNGQINVQEPQ